MRQSEPTDDHGSPTGNAPRATPARVSVLHASGALTEEAPLLASSRPGVGVPRKIFRICAPVIVILGGPFCTCTSPAPPPEDRPYLSVLYTTGNAIWFKETHLHEGNGTFQDPGAVPRHLAAGGLEANLHFSEPSATLYKGSQWAAWREGNTLVARAIWQGPSRKRIIRSSDVEALTPPAIASFNGRLVVVWGEAGRLHFSTSEHGVRWTEPVPHLSVLPHETSHAPAVAVHQGHLYVGTSNTDSGRLYTIRINPDFTWGPNFLAMVSQDPLVPGVSLASYGTKLSMGYATPYAIRVAHSANGYSGWTTPVNVDTNTDSRYLSAPAIFYWNNRLYVFFNLAGYPQLVMKRSNTYLGLLFSSAPVPIDWAGFRRPSVVASDYSVIGPEPQVTLVKAASHPSGHMNVIYISEAYNASQMHEYRATVQRSIAAYTLLSPLRQNLSLVNIYRVDLVSRQTGVDVSPDLAEAYSFSSLSVGQIEPLYTDTALGSQLFGYFTDPTLDGWAEDPTVDSSAYVPQFQRELWADYELVHALLARVIPTYQRSRDISYVVTRHSGNVQKVAAIPLVNTYGFFERMGFIHETGHSLAGLSDEDIDNQCAPIEQVGGECKAPNKTLNPDLRDPEHKWAHFFVDHNQNGIMDPGDSILAEVSPSWAGAEMDGRSNYWEPGVLTRASALNMGIWATFGARGWPPDGQVLYGPSQQCLMNHTGAVARFCAVCAEAIVRSIWTRATGGFSQIRHRQYHESYSRVFLEYEHLSTGVDPAIKDGFLEVNGIPVPEDTYNEACHGLGRAYPSETCSLDISELVQVGQAETLITFRNLFSRPTYISVQTIAVVNGNGAVMPIRPVSDLSAPSVTDYSLHIIWNFRVEGDLVLAVRTNRRQIP